MLNYQLEEKIITKNTIRAVDTAVNNKASEMDDSRIDQVLAQVNIAAYADFKKQLSNSWQQAANEGEMISVLMCEIDFFDEYVASHGVQGACFMLLVVALALKTVCEQHDCFLAHYQQQKFTVLIKGGNHKEALELSKLLCKAVENSRTEHQYSSVSQFVTLSIGVSVTAPKLKDILKQNVDNALQNAKIAGRNRVSNDLVKRKFVETVKNSAPSPNETQQNNAPRYNENAPNCDKTKEFTEQQQGDINTTSRMYRGHDLFADPNKEMKEVKKAVKPAVRMYRGHPIV